jgi:hypothetical protein
MMAAHLASCRRAHPTQGDSQRAPDAQLALLPRETQIVLAVDLDRLRGQPVWKALSSVLARNAKPFLDAIAAGTGIEPVTQVHRIWIGLPGQRQPDGRFALLVEADPVDTVRAAAWLQKQGRGEMAIRFPSPRSVFIGKGAWAAPPTARTAHSAADDPQLRRLCERAAREHAIWFAALVPTDIRKTLMGQSRMADAGSLARVFGFLDDAGGLHAEVVGELTNTEDPPLLAHRLQAFHNQAKRDPDLLVAGLSPYLEALHVGAHDATVRAVLDLPDAQAGDVIERIEGLALTTRTKYSRAP